MPCPDCGAITKDDAVCSDCKTITATVERIGNHSRGVGLIQRLPRIQRPIGGVKPRVVEKAVAKPDELDIDLTKQQRATETLAAQLNQIVSGLKNVPLGMGASSAALFERGCAACLQIKDLS